MLYHIVNLHHIEVIAISANFSSTSDVPTRCRCKNETHVYSRGKKFVILNEQSETVYTIRLIFIFLSLIYRKTSHSFIYREGQLDGQEIEPNMANISKLKSTFTTKVLVHGFKNNQVSGFNEKVKNAWIRKKNVQVIVIEWSPAKCPCYPYPRSQVSSIREELGELLEAFDASGVICLGSTTLFGHSLGF